MIIIPLDPEEKECCMEEIQSVSTYTPDIAKYLPMYQIQINEK
jgi:hypothetical protein